MFFYFSFSLPRRRVHGHVHGHTAAAWAERRGRHGRKGHGAPSLHAKCTPQSDARMGSPVAVRSAVHRLSSLPVPPAPHVVQRPSTPVVPSRACRLRDTLTRPRRGSCLPSRIAVRATFVAYDGRRSGGGGGRRRSDRHGSPGTVGTADCRTVGAPSGTASRPSCPSLPTQPPYSSTLHQRA